MIMINVNKVDEALEFTIDSGGHDLGGYYDPIRTGTTYPDRALEIPVRVRYLMDPRAIVEIPLVGIEIQTTRTELAAYIRNITAELGQIYDQIISVVSTTLEGDHV